MWTRIVLRNRLIDREQADSSGGGMSAKRIKLKRKRTRGPGQQCGGGRWVDAGEEGIRGISSNGKIP